MNIKYDKIIINIPEELLKAFDDACEGSYFTRSEGIKQAMRDFIQIQGDEPGTPKQQKEQIKLLMTSFAEAGLELGKDPKFAQLTQQNANPAQPKKLPRSKNS